MITASWLAWNKWNHSFPHENTSKDGQILNKRKNAVRTQSCISKEKNIIVIKLFKGNTNF